MQPLERCDTDQLKSGCKISSRSTMNKLEALFDIVTPVAMAMSPMYIKKQNKSTEHNNSKINK